MEKIRNFCIIAHIDHGKSTLADRFLELTKTVPLEKMRDQLLDQMDLERERGITIQLQPVRMEYKGYVLNLIDTPGHMDFRLEVEKSLRAVEGALLLVDAVKGVQAQTLSNLYLAQQQNLVIIPIINKIDLNNARPQEVEEELMNLLKIEKEKIIKISAKNGTNIEQVLEAIIERIPCPKGSPDLPLKTLVFDSFYDPYKGIIAYIRVVDGVLKKERQEIGIFKPQLVVANELSAGEIGYIATGEKNLEEYLAKIGWEKPKPMVFASLYPREDSEFNLLKDAINKLKLNDAALYSEEESSPALGRGFKCGFLGMLHLEIIAERLKREFNLDLVATTPRVNYEILKKESIVKEPWVRLEIVTSHFYFGNVMNLLKGLRGNYQETKYLSNERMIVVYNTPLADIVTDFYDKLKSATSGYASMIYEPIGSRPGKLIKLEVLLAKEHFQNLSQIVPEEEMQKRARNLALSLKELVPKQNFAVAIQIVLGNLFEEESSRNVGNSKIVARETIPALRKDVTAPLYGGDYTRKKKLLDIQKKGKKELAAKGRVRIPAEVFINLLKQK
ncbi:MAG: translation elongation factor 4 [Candidatus Nealsonbacteria bacterium]|nr:translation elongation factor 4 [Candidatus Nealsonbacteria bacterium]